MFTFASRLPGVVKSLAPNLKCLLHMDGGEGSTSWVDALGHTVSPSGSVVQKSAAAKFGTSGTQFSGSTDMLTVSSSGDLAFGTGDFGLSCWVNRTSSGASYQAVASTRIISDQDNRIYWELGIQSTGGVYFYSGGFQIAVNTNLVPVGNWTHLEVNRSSGATKVYVNGILAGSFSDTGNYASGTITIGAFNSGSADTLTAYMDEFAVSVGAPLHTANFTPPSSPYT